MATTTTTTLRWVTRNEFNTLMHNALTLLEQGATIRRLGPQAHIIATPGGASVQIVYTAGSERAAIITRWCDDDAPAIYAAK